MNHFSMTPRRCLFRMLGWFFFVNSLLASLVIFGYLPLFISLKFVPQATIGSTLFAWVSFVLAFFAQVSLYEFSAAAICCVIATFFPWRVLIISLAGIFSATLLAALIGDAIAFRLYHMHYAEIGWQVYQAGAFNEVLSLDKKEQLIIYGAFSLSVLLEMFFALWLWRLFSKPGYRTARSIIFVFVIANWLFVYSAFGFALGGHVWSGGYRYAILRVGRVVPYLSELYLKLFESHDIRHLIINHKKIPIVIKQILEPLHYPKQALVCKSPQSKKNILIIGIDTWRFTSMNPVVSPNIYQFSKQAIQFNHHYSGGNCTQPGLFSLFYALPPNYWQAFLDQKQGPVLMQKLVKAGYAMGIFLSAPINFPQFDHTIFSDIKNLPKKTRGQNSLARDKSITQKFIQFVKNRDPKQPFFSFLFYDALHNYCEAARPKLNPFQPSIASCDRLSLDRTTNPTPYINLYNNKMLFIDNEVGKVLRALHEQHLEENTIVIITADHGEQINDEGIGLWGHASAYNSYQLHIPMLVYWPKHKSMIIERETTHYDVAPTLMKKVLGCTNDPKDYSVGQDLLNYQSPSYFVAASYGDYAVVMPDKVMRIYPDGDYTLLDRRGHFVSQDAVNAPLLYRVVQDLKAYFKNDAHHTN